MKKTAILFFITMSCLVLSGQEIGKFFILNNEIPPDETREYVASEYINMQYGFYAHPAPQNYVLARIDPLLVFPPEEGETGGSGNNNTGGVVGTLPGSVAVSPMGGATYNIPIDLPPGTAGMTPSLSLVYNSQGGNGLLGIGWSLAGLSAITRTGTTLYREGFIDGVDFDANDKLALDGQRLISINSNTEYRTEIESFSKIIPNGSFANMPEWFEVFTKDGRIIEYGNTTDSRIETSDGSHVLMWLVNRIKDRKGNYIDFEYTEENGIGRISKVKYTGNTVTNLNTYYEVAFEYRYGRSDPIKHYVSGREIKIDVLMDNIKVKYSGSTLSTYQLHYNSDGFYSNLEDVTLENAEGNHFNPILFEWEENNHDILTETHQYNEAKVDRFFLDYNGDGKTDMVEAYYDIYEDKKAYTDWYYRERTDNGFSGLHQFEEIIPKFFSFVLIGDYNGDGLQDMLRAKYTHENYETLKIDMILFSNGLGFDEHYLHYIGDIPSENMPELKIGDFDGDGINELLLSYKNMGESEDNTFIWKFMEEFPYSNLVFSDRIDYGNIDLETTTLLTGDFNGDGRTDLLRTGRYGSPGGAHSSNCFLYEVDIPSGSVKWIYDDGFPTVWHRIYPADFNGDGITDILTYTYANPDIGWEVHCFNGKDEWVQFDVPPLTNFDPEDEENQFYHGISIADFDGDGKTDIAEFEKRNFPEIVADYIIYYSNGNAFEKDIPVTGQIQCIGGLNFFGGGYFIKNIRQHFNLDFNGDGKRDLYNDQGPYNDLVYLFDYSNNYNLIQKFTNGLGHETQITYKPLTDDNVYTKGSGADYPVVDVQPALYVVDSVTADNAIGSKVVSVYSYQGAKVHARGKGFLGYQKLTTIANPGSDFETKTESIFNYNDVYYFAYLDQRHSYADIPGGNLEPISSTFNTEPTVELFGPSADKRIFFYTPASVTQVHHTGDNSSSYIKTVRTEQVFNTGNDLTYGNVSISRTYAHPAKLDLNDPASAYDYSSVADFNYYYDDPAIDAWLISRVKNATTTTTSKKDPTSSTDIQYVSYDYWGVSPYIETETHVPNNSTEMTTVSSYVYDDYGNVKKRTISAPGFYPDHPPVRVTNYTYSPEYQRRFVTETKKTINGTDFISTATYYPNTGQLQSETNVNHLTTNYFYDGFGRLTKTVFPDGVTAQQVMRWSNNSGENPAHGLYRLWSQSSGNAESSVYFDQLGRELRAVTENYRGSKVYADKEYNSFGQLEKTSAPYYAGEQKQWTNYTYLTTGAVKTMISPTANITYAYNGRTTETTNNLTGITTTKEADAIGNMVKATDPGGIINYSYLSSGQLYTLAMGENTTTILYDEAGFQQSLEDSDAGTTTYKYNPFGELLEQTDNSGNIYKMTYDALGRMTTKLLENKTHYTYYVYDEDANALGKLNSITSAWNDITISYDYDSYTRVKAKTETIKGEAYTFVYDYNIYGKLKTETWPDNFSITNKYTKGYLTSVQRPATGKTLWKLTDINARGQIKQYLLGNGLMTTKTYTPNGFLKEIETGNIQQLKYDFNETTGNLNWREDLSGSFNLHEDFTYDDDKLKNRLETWQVENRQTYSISYADNGNFNSKTDVGSNFIYGEGMMNDNVGPHAIKRIMAPAADYLNMARSVQNITYTGFNKTGYISVMNNDNGIDKKWELNIEYGPDNFRRTTRLTMNNELVKSKVFAGGNYEIETDARQQQRRLHYISGGNGLCAIYVTDDENSEGTMYYILKDHLGSIYAVTNENAEIATFNGRQQIYSFDPWGRRRNPDTWTFEGVADEYLFDRGFTGHEHLDDLGLINMNGRMYEPWLGRFLSPDNYVQMPDYSQNLNRYSYVLNNPLKYTDPSGEVYLWDDVIVAGVGFAIGYVSYGIINDDWGWNAVAAGGIGAAMALIGYYTFGGGLAAMQSGSLLGELGAGLSYSGNLFLNSAVNQVMPQANIPINDNLSISVGPSVFFGDQMSVGLQVGATYTTGNWSFSAGMRLRGGTSNYGPSTLTESVFSGRVGWDDGTTGIYGTYSYFSNPSQSTGGVGFRQGDVSFYVENDFFVQSGDKYRTHAMQLTYKDFSLGLRLYTGNSTLDEPEVSNGPGLGGNGTHTGPNAGKYRLGALSGGYKGYEAGWTSEGIRNATQNWWHDRIGDARFAILKNEFPGRPYFQYSTGYNYTLW